MNILGLIPARAGSKGVPGKNTREMAGKPLLAWSIEVGMAAGIGRLVVSTDSPAMAAVARQFGVDTPWLRPAEIAADTTPMVDVIRHALAEEVARGFAADAVVLLQPTSPLRRVDHVRQAVDLLESSGCDSVVTVLELPLALSPDCLMRVDNGRLQRFIPGTEHIRRRQDARPAYLREGTVYVFRTATLDRFGDIYGDDCRPLVIDAADSLSIDTPDDWQEAERRLTTRLTKESS